MHLGCLFVCFKTKIDFCLLIKGQTSLFPLTVLFALSALRFHLQESMKRKIGKRWRFNKNDGGMEDCRGWGAQVSIS